MYVEILVKYMYSAMPKVGSFSMKITLCMLTTV